jgi:hypothetical protein
VRREEAQRLADGAWFATCLSAGLNWLLAAFWIRSGVTEVAGVNPWTFVVTGALVFGLGYGVHRGNRTCAILLVLAFTVDVLYKLVARGPSIGLAVTLVFGCFYVRGLRGVILLGRLSEPPMPST